MAKAVELANGRRWETRNAAIEHFKAMLARYDNEAVIEDRVDHEDLTALLERYDAVVVDQPTKIGAGIDCFLKRANRGVGWTTPSFWVRRTDGSETDWSFRWAIKGEPKSEAHEFYDACRAAVAADLAEAKKRHFSDHGDAGGRVECDLTGEPVDFANAHLDHAYPPFIQIVLGFRAARGWQHGAPDGVLARPMDRQATTTFAEEAVAGAFRDYHGNIALLRIVSRDANLSMAAGQRRPKVKRPVTLRNGG